MWTNNGFYHLCDFPSWYSVHYRSQACNRMEMCFFAERWWHHAKSPFPSWTTMGTTQMPCFRTHYTSINAIVWGGFDCDCADSIAEKHSLLQPVIQACHSPALNLPLLLPSCPHDSPQHISAVILYKWNYFVHEVFYNFYYYKLAVGNDIMGLN